MLDPTVLKLIDTKCRSPPAPSLLKLTSKKMRRRIKMKKINLKDIYPVYKDDCFVLVDDEIAQVFEETKRIEANYRRQLYRNKAHYSLDRNDGIENDALFVSLSPYEIYERKVSQEELYAAISKLTDIQAKRLYAHYFQGMSKSNIARAEGVSVKAVCKSIKLALLALEKELKNI